jgi:hypothetical protein
VTGEGLEKQELSSLGLGHRTRLLTQAGVGFVGMQKACTGFPTELQVAVSTSVGTYRDSAQEDLGIGQENFFSFFSFFDAIDNYDIVSYKIMKPLF